MKKLLLLAVLISSLAFGQDEAVDTCHGIGNDCVAWQIEQDFTDTQKALFVRFGYIKFAQKWEQVHYEVQVAVTTAILDKYTEGYFIDVVTGITDPSDLRTRVILQVMGNYDPGGSADLAERIQAPHDAELTIGDTYNGVDINRLAFVRGKLISASGNRAVIDVGRNRLISCNIHSLWK